MSYNGRMEAPASSRFGTAVRTILFVRADDAHRRERAWTSGADAVILDLEDAVAPDAKAAARAGLADALERRAPGPLAVVRVNAPDSDHGERDLHALAGLPIDAVVVPKASPASIELARGGGRPIVALIETAAGVLHAESIASAAGVALLMLGSVDLTAELGCEPSAPGHELLLARSWLVLASAAAGLPAPIDGPCLSTDDLERVHGEAVRAAGLGFGGKACIHPAQLDPVRRAFTPGPEQVAWSARVVAAYEAAATGGSGVVSIDGQMIDAPVARRAYAILQRSGEVR
jgi:citrate lyase subunit beta/citryl-CoA lyase